MSINLNLKKKDSNIQHANFFLSHLPDNSAVTLPNDDLEYNFVYISTLIVPHKDTTSNNIVLSKVLDLILSDNFRELNCKSELKKYFKTRLFQRE